jgi:hypothetical protein
LVLEIRGQNPEMALTGLQLVRLSDKPAGFGLHPGVLLSQAESLANSKVTLAPGAWTGGRHQWAFVGASGHAWSLTRLDWQSTEPLVVELVPAAGVSFSLKGVPAIAGSQVRLDLLDEAGQLERNKSARFAAPAADQSLSIEGLVPGRYRVRVLGADAQELSSVQAEEQLTLAAGQQNALELKLVAPGALPPKTLSGTLFVPAEWGPKAPKVQVSPFGQVNETTLVPTAQAKVALTPVPDQAGHYTWQQPIPDGGQYAFTVRLGLQAYQVFLTVPLEGQADVQIAVPSQARVKVRCLDQATREPLRGLRVDAQASVQFPSGIGQTSMISSAPANSPEFELQLLAGPNDFFCSTPGHVLVNGHHELVAGDQELELFFTTQSLLRLGFRDGERLLPVPKDARFMLGIKLTSTDGQHEGKLTGFFDDIAQIQVPVPGRYTLSVPQFPGYEAIAPQEVDLSTSPVDLNLPLTPLR